MYMDDIKLFAKNEKELETLIHEVRIYSQDIGMEFGIEKCAMLVMKSSKRHITDGMELPNHNRIRTLEENETYKYLGILDADTIKQVQMKDTIRKEYFRGIRKLLEKKTLQQKPHQRNKYLGFAPPSQIFETLSQVDQRTEKPFLKWTREPFLKWTKEQENWWTCIRHYTPETTWQTIYI